MSFAKRKQNLYETNPLISLLNKHNITTWQLARCLSCDYAALKRQLKRPGENFSAQKIALMAGLMNVSIVCVLGAILGFSQRQTAIWYNSMSEEDKANTAHLNEPISPPKDENTK